MPTLVASQVQIDVCPREVADLFCRMDSNEQAEFWLHLASYVDAWENIPGIQWQMMRDAIIDLADNRALRAFQEMAQYAE